MRRGRPEAWWRKVLDLHGLPVHENLEIVLRKVQDPSLILVGHDDIDVDDFDFDAIGERLGLGLRLLAQRGQQGPGGEEK